MENIYLLKVDVNGKAERIPFDPKNSYEIMSQAVDGYLELAPVELPHGADLFVNEEGKLIGLPLNKVLTRYYVSRNGWIDEIMGNGIIAKHDENGDSVGLTETECDDVEKALFQQNLV